MTMTSDEENQDFLRRLFGDKPDPASSPSENDTPETEMRKFTHRIFNRDND